MKLHKLISGRNIKIFFVRRRTDIGIFLAVFVFFCTFIMSGTFFVAKSDADGIEKTVFHEANMARDRINIPENAVLLSEVQEHLKSSDAAEKNIAPEAQYALDSGNKVLLYDTASGECMSYFLEDYVTGALLAEMPTAYEPEALKAQAVSCRTYALYKMTNGTFHENGADLCTNPAHCQAFAQKNSVSAERYQKARAAVDATAGEIMLYEEKPILAVFHASSGRSTKSSEEVWGGKLSYLCSVQTWEIDNPELSASKNYSFPMAEFLKRLSVPYNASPDITTTKTQSGKVTEVKIEGKSYTGSDFVKIFGLRSADFDISVSGETVDIVANGYGHGVGLSQLGAQDLAQKGYSYREILGHYYTGVTFGTIKNQTAL